MTNMKTNEELEKEFDEKFTDDVGITFDGVTALSHVVFKQENLFIGKDYEKATKENMPHQIKAWIKENYIPRIDVEDLLKTLDDISNGKVYPSINNINDTPFDKLLIVISDLRKFIKSQLLKKNDEEN